MGILKILAVSAAGIWSARAVSRINAKVSRIAVPRASILASQAKDYGDFYADAFVIELPQRVAFSNIPVNVSQLVKSFFSCRVFSSFEKPLLKLVFSLKEPLLNKSEFYLGEKTLLWQVAYRGNDDILMEWKGGNLRGFSWFHISSDQRLIMFGSSIGFQGSHFSQLSTDYSPLESAINSVQVLKNNPYEESIVTRIRSFMVSLISASILSVHQFYSRLLLLSTLRTLVLEEKW